MHVTSVKKYFHFTLCEDLREFNYRAYSSLCFDCNIKYHVAQSFSYFLNSRLHGLEKWV